MYFGIVVAVFVLDFFTKLIVKKGIEVGVTVPFIKGFMDLTHVQNTGAAFGIFAKHGEILLYVTAGLIVLITLYVLIRHKKMTGIEIAALGMIVGCGLGNGLSRYLDGYVTDFLNCHFWPIFNVADIFICVGCILLLIAVLIVEPIRNGAKRKKEEKAKAKKERKAAEAETQAAADDAFAAVVEPIAAAEPVAETPVNEQ